MGNLQIIVAVQLVQVFLEGKETLHIMRKKQAVHRWVFIINKLKLHCVESRRDLWK